VATLAREWGQRAIDDFGPAAAELVIVLAAAAGDAEYRVPDADQDSAETMIATAAQRASFKKLKGAEWRNFHVNFERFWAALTQDAQAESMANSIVECASVCAVKALRLQGTIAGMACGMGLLEKRVKVLDELARTRRMFDAEVDACVSKMADGAKKTSLAEATAALREALDAAVHAVGRQVSQAELQTQQATNAEDTEDPVCETVQDCTDEWREQGRGNVLTDKARQLAIDCVRLCKEVRVLERKALEGKDAVFQVIATKRFRDVDAEIRAATGELLGRWASVCPEALATTQRSKYLGWMLFDKHADVRLAALHALGKVFEDMDAAQALESFVARFAPRVKGCLFDPEPKVIVAALHVSKVWLARGLLKPEDGEHLVECERCLFVDDLPVREAAARFTMQAHEADMGKAQESVARRLRGLCDVIVAHLEGRECHELVAGVVEAFWAVDKAAMGNFGELVQLLAEGNLSAEVARVAASMLVAAVECNKGKLPSAVASALPGLVVTHRTNARVEQCLVDLVARSEIGAWASDAALDKLVRELKWCVMENRRESDLAFSAFAALAHLAQDKQPGKRKVEKALEDLVGELQECEPTARNLAVLASFLLSTGAPARGVVDKIDLMDIASVAAEQADVELLASSLKLGFAVVAADAAAADAVGAEASGLRASRETLVNVLSVALRSDLAECALLAVGLLHDTRVLLSPVQQGTHGGWVAPADMLAQADAVLSKAVGGVDKGADPQDALCTMLLAHGLCETAVLPACRAALFATSREDVRSLAHVLRLLVTSDLPGMERETKALVDEMLDEDAARLMQAGLEAVEAGGAELGERIVAKLAHKASLSEPAGRMLRRAIVKGLAREELGVFRGLGAFCQLLKGAEKKRTLDAWNTALAAKKASDAEFDSRLEAGELGDVLEFEACLNGKKPRARAAAKTPKSSAKRVKRQPVRCHAPSPLRTHPLELRRSKTRARASVGVSRRRRPRTRMRTRTSRRRRPRCPNSCLPPSRLRAVRLRSAPPRRLRPSRRPRRALDVPRRRTRPPRRRSRMTTTTTTRRTSPKSVTAATAATTTTWRRACLSSRLRNRRPSLWPSPKKPRRRLSAQRPRRRTPSATTATTRSLASGPRLAWAGSGRRRFLGF